MSYVDSLRNQSAPRPGLTERRSWSRCKQFETVIVLLKELFENSLEIVTRPEQRHEKVPILQRVNESMQNVLFALTVTKILSGATGSPSFSAKSGAQA